MIKSPIPKAQSSIADSKGLPTREWYGYLRQIGETINLSEVQQSQLDEIIARIDALEDGDSQSFQILGFGSVSVSGSPSNGLVQIALSGDVESPGGTWYYGTGSLGERGWHPISGTIDVVPGELSKSVDPITGVVTLGLSTPPESGCCEILVADGISPPVMLTDEAETDFLYEG